MERIRTSFMAHMATDYGDYRYSNRPRRLNIRSQEIQSKTTRKRNTYQTFTHKYTSKYEVFFLPLSNPLNPTATTFNGKIAP